MEKMKGFI